MLVSMFVFRPSNEVAWRHWKSTGPPTRIELWNPRYFWKYQKPETLEALRLRKTHTDTHIRTNTCTHAHTHTNAHAHTHTKRDTHRHGHRHTYTNTQTHTHIHTHTQTQTDAIERGKERKRDSERCEERYTQGHAKKTGLHKHTHIQFDPSSCVYPHPNSPYSRVTVQKKCLTPSHVHLSALHTLTPHSLPAWPLSSTTTTTASPLACVLDFDWRWRRSAACYYLLYLYTCLVSWGQRRKIISLH